MKATLLTLCCSLLLAASTQAGELCQAPFDVVQPRVPDKLRRVTLNQRELGGEIGRRMKNLIYQNYMAVDLDDKWLNHFRNRTDRDGRSHVYYGVGKVLDAGSLFAAYTGDPKVAARTQYIIDELVKSRDADGYLGFWNVEPENRQDHINWILHEQEYINLGSCGIIVAQAIRNRWPMRRSWVTTSSRRFPRRRIHATTRAKSARRACRKGCWSCTA